MFKTIGIVAVLAIIGLGVAHFTGHLALTGSADVTDKGHALVDDGIDGAQGLANKGFDAIRSEKAKPEVK